MHVSGTSECLIVLSAVASCVGSSADEVRIVVLSFHVDALLDHCHAGKA